MFLKHDNQQEWFCFTRQPGAASAQSMQFGQAGMSTIGIAKFFRFFSTIILQLPLGHGPAY
jgi:hypothetical protein